uniref:DUF116 domain-containing protein n=1 Tax=candidate division WOR-3 bacterium TaxID=2052148 RepID=A0A7C4XTK5_UNCW3
MTAVANRRKKWRLLDTGQLSASENIALDRVLLESRAKGWSPNTVRFLQFSPPAVLIGYHQSVEQEVRVDYCETHNIHINRRITGGGTVFFDESQLGWEIIADKSFFNLNIANPAFFERVSTPIVRALNRLGISARFRPRNDIEVRGKKISGTGGTEMDNTFLFQGTLLVDFDIDTMLRALRVPIEKLKRHEIEAFKDRVTCIKWELNYLPRLKDLKSVIKRSFEETFHIELNDGELLSEERELFNKILPDYSSFAWINKVKSPAVEQPMVWVSLYTPGGIIKAFFVINLRFHYIQSVVITGDFFVTPPEIIYNLEALLKGIPLDKELIEKRIKEFFSQHNHSMAGILSCDFISIIDRLFEKLDLCRFNLQPPLSNHIFLVNGTFEQILSRRPRFLLLPYCAKSPECGYRYKKECAECNECTVGQAYHLSQRFNLEPITITSFEDLMQTLREFKRKDVNAYIGCCCEQFFVKHQDDFEASGISAILLDINSETCYDLGKASFAYRGEFESQTNLNLDLLKMVLNVL